MSVGIVVFLRNSAISAISLLNLISNLCFCSLVIISSNLPILPYFWFFFTLSISYFKNVIKVFKVTKPLLPVLSGFSMTSVSDDW